ncbi:MAG: 4-amino-4-deoxy-L-arabinose transferase [Gammaproteobacteria bacterium GWE2_42_36]|nr:MAG: 4-amino-4-deoxy-L-arabinose transferase [Gammaproteobacteria bacterium GWE2_42_36]HCU04704.1 4-amino-4-deoxy-L-arabinose transferase [Coxiellaceae bacterium]
MTILVFSIVFACMLLNALAQLLLKAAMNHIGTFTFTLPSLIPIGIKVATSPYIISGITCYVLSVILWLLVLSRTDVSIAYPLTSIGFILAPIGAYLFLGENLSATRIVGILVILLGVYFVTRS